MKKGSIILEFASTFPVSMCVGPVSASCFTLEPAPLLGAKSSSREREREREREGEKVAPADRKLNNNGMMMMMMAL